MAKTTQLILEMLNTEKDRLFQYASYRLHDIRDVEDVLQNIYVKILDNPLRFNRIENKRAYLYRILSNECTDYLRTFLGEFHKDSKRLDKASINVSLSNGQNFKMMETKSIETNINIPESIFIE